VNGFLLGQEALSPASEKGSDRRHESGLQNIKMKNVQNFFNFFKILLD
jgi:hypothetical protein